MRADKVMLSRHDLIMIGSKKEYGMKNREHNYGTREGTYGSFANLTRVDLSGRSRI